MNSGDRRVRRMRKLLYEALISLVLERKYDSITIQNILDRADVGRSTFYTHFDSRDEMLISGMGKLGTTLQNAVGLQRASARSRENVVAFSRAMFEHAHDYREIYNALLHTSAWPLVRQRLQEILDDIIREEVKAEIIRLRRTDSEIPVDLFVHYLNASFFAVLTWWLIVVAA